MSGYIPEEIINSIQDRIDIVELISGYIPLKRAGRNFRALCPFHHEKTPSFMVNPDKQIYHCFGCGVGGNVFNFLMRHERIEFPEAVEVLAKKVGIELPKVFANKTANTNLKEQLYKVNEIACNFYENLLLNSKGAQRPLEYLKKLSIQSATIKKFRLGYAPNSWDYLINHLRTKGMALSLLEKAGLIILKENQNGYYDRFRDRLIFPIFDIKSRCLGFGARVLDDSLPKYINSPETLIYVKGNSLYGLEHSREAITQKDFVIIVEGYLDFITPFQAGIENMVASLGTSLTVEQIRLIKRYTHNVVMLYDADKAGELATLRSLELLLEEEMDVKVVSLETGFDPDAFVRKYGAEALEQKIRQARPLFDYKLNLLFSKFSHKEIDGKAKIAQEMLITISKFKDAVLKFGYLKKLSEALSVKEEALLIELNNIKNKPLYQIPMNSNFVKTLSPIKACERMIIKLLLSEDRFINLLRENLEISDFQDSKARQIVEILFDLASRGEPVKVSKLMNYFQDQVSLDAISELCMVEDLAGGEREEILQDCINRLKQERHKSKLRELVNQIKSVEASQDKHKLEQLVYEYNQLIKGTR